MIKYSFVNKLKAPMCGRIPKGFTVVYERPLLHPNNSAQFGMLLQNERTGIYAMCMNGVVSAVRKTGQERNQKGVVQNEIDI